MVQSAGWLILTYERLAKPSVRSHIIASGKVVSCSLYSRKRNNIHASINVLSNPIWELNAQTVYVYDWLVMK